MTSLILIQIVASGCTSIINERVNKESECLKEPSLALYDITHIRDESLNSFIENRVASIFTGAKVYQHTHDPNRYGIKSDSKGIAAAISKQGYFLTAAHCVDTKDDITIILLSAPGLRKVPARVVWLSKAYDIALISIGEALKYSFEMALNTPDPNTIAIAGGFLKHSAGRVLSLSKASSTDDGLMLINHNCPIVDGDSGGPLMSQDGLLLGVNHSTSWKIKLFSATISNYEATAIDSKWLQDQIKRDIDITSQSKGLANTRP